MNNEQTRSDFEAWLDEPHPHCASIIRRDLVPKNDGGFIFLAWQAATLKATAAQAEPCQNESMKPHQCNNRHQCWEPCGELGHSAEHARVSERNFCERCGKRLGSSEHIHTCTPPDDRSPADKFCDKYCVMTDHHPACKYAPAAEGGNV